MTKTDAEHIATALRQRAATAARRHRRLTRASRRAAGTCPAIAALVLPALLLAPSTCAGLTGARPGQEPIDRHGLARSR